jgi:5-methyltetrahydropteroyltriglutamate--homocysteine methyltransferase
VNELSVCGIEMDFVLNSENIENIRKFGFLKSKQLIAGIVSGCDISLDPEKII